jgi:5-methylcytosine-specific restriction endonuclease McrA
MINKKQRHKIDIALRKSIKYLNKNGMEREERMSEINRLLEEYFDTVGEYPNSDYLDKMADVILKEELSSIDTHKMSHEEYPILSDSQYARRKQGSYRRKGGCVEVELDESVQYFDKGLGYQFNIPDETTPMGSAELELEIAQYSKLNKESPVTIYFIDPQPVEKKERGKHARTEDDAAWARKVKERDNYTCQNPACKKRVGVMHAHHLNSYVDNPFLRTDIGNGVTICEDCHNEFHKQYGRGYNTEFEYLDWIEEEKRINY